MKTSAVEFSFPVLGFTPDDAIWGFPDLERLTSCGPTTLKEDSQRGMELIDAKGNRWVVQGIQRIGRGRFSWLAFFGLTTRQNRIEQELEPLQPVDLVEIRRRALVAMKSSEENFVQHDEDQAEFDQLFKKVQAAKSVSVIYDLLQPDTFEGW